jgi:hypothetical protein
VRLVGGVDLCLCLPFLPAQGRIFYGAKDVRQHKPCSYMVRGWSGESVLVGAGGRKGDSVAGKERVVLKGVERAVVVVDVDSCSARSDGALHEELGEAAGGAEEGEMCPRSEWLTVQSWFSWW